MYYRLTALLLLLPVFLQAQIKHASPDVHLLFTAGVASGLMGGLYDGFYPIDSLKNQGDFGLGAPDKLDGELLILHGKIYQTQYTGKTFEVLDHQQRVPFCMVNFFKAAIVLHVKQQMDKGTFYHYLDSLLPNVNGMYAIHVKGRFPNVKTRAFPPVNEQPYPQLAGMLDLQRFFQLKETSGDLVGYRLPVYMDNTNISGYHFHFLSDDKNTGGHIVDLTTGDITIEISPLDSYTVKVPATPAFNHFDFKKDRQEDIKSVERGAIK
ncbi:acetolactate decarboxylase [Chitinophaga arvensicola]|uniref:Alpha-acetolactate decarboxylase n=1 Tax=Chitinophaga arvensicola TaxID=29529 RepID=A0A1I0S969_9BACT|nr:acetolactate decarboxylase [Chitinophaga arvensicola]SEW52709.1 acetolactate decarboxylase [Chitinophaga arvensicola]